LLREIANCIKDGKTLPVPSEVDDVVQFTPAIGHNNVVLIDPL